MYSEKQLKELAKGAFQCSPKEPAFYAAENGTFLNSIQYAKLNEDQKKGFMKIENPALAQSDAAEDKAAKEAAAAEAKAAKEAEAAAKKAAAAEAKAAKEAEAAAKKAAAAEAKAAKKESKQG